MRLNISVVFSFSLLCGCCDFQLLEQKMLELRRVEEKSSSRSEELSQIVKVNQEVLFTFV